MTSSREEVLGRIRASLNGVTAPEEPGASIPREYRRHSAESRESVIARFAMRVAEYRATVQRVQAVDLPAAIAAALERRVVRQLVIPADLPAAWLPAGIQVLVDEQLSASALDAADGVLIGCACGIAETGTIVLDGGARQGRRAITLVPDYHLCVVEEEQIVDLVPEAIERLHAAAQSGQPITLISGPSATSDIELNRVEGVHGPRTLEVLIVRSEGG